MKDLPLVSIVIITYNSSRYVLETLESAKTQTYQNIELIVSDDCSKDNTVDICRKWIEENKDRFIRTELITVAKNTGISPNCNRGCKVARGEWIKLIAGDDALLNNCIEDYMNLASQNDKIKIMHSKAAFYKDILDEKSFLEDVGDSYPILMNDKYSPQEQFKYLSFGCHIKSCSIIIKKELLEAVGYYDESIPMCEDLPMFLKVTLDGYSIFFLNKSTVKYRMNDHSIYIGQSKNLLVHPFYKIDYVIYKKYVYPHCGIIRRFMQSYYYNGNRLFYSLKTNQSSTIGKVAYKCFYRIFYMYQSKVVKKILTHSI